LRTGGRLRGRQASIREVSDRLSASGSSAVGFVGAGADVGAVIDLSARAELTPWHDGIRCRIACPGTAVAGRSVGSALGAVFLIELAIFLGTVPRLLRAVVGVGFGHDVILLKRPRRQRGSGAATSL
jgi:hypothetical protein